MALGIAVVSLLLLCYLYLKLRAADCAFVEMNQRDWHIHLLPKPSLFARLFNIIIDKRGASLLITLLEKTAIASALKKSVRQMEEAEASGRVPAIL
ncbi:hypothetical protein H4N54_17990 [Limnospira fusiformis KN01]|nr:MULTISPECIES: hypothetical protein [Limnospira]MDT9201251.1 hypothetical protein [Limnospira sp. PMC 1042.18]ULB44315.1 hypothetical protein H4N54_17990 [Limnospira fusiformis KN01]